MALSGVGTSMPVYRGVAPVIVVGLGRRDGGRAGSVVRRGGSGCDGLMCCARGLMLLGGVLVVLHLLFRLVLLLEASEKEVDELLQAVDLVLRPLEFVLVRIAVGRRPDPHALVAAHSTRQARALSRALHLANAAAVGRRTQDQREFPEVLACWHGGNGGIRWWDSAG